MTKTVEPLPNLNKTIAADVVVRQRSSLSAPFSDAASDIFEGLRLVRLAGFLAWREFFLPYRFGFLGPLWTTLQTALWVIVIGLFLGPSLNSKGVHYFAYIAIGYTLYSLFVVYFSEGSQLFIKSKSYILNIPNPFSIYALKLVVKAGIHLLMALPVIVATIVFTDVPVNSVSLLVIPGFIISSLFGFGAGLMLGTITVFYRDVGFLVQAIMRLLMFMTPIFWVLEGEGMRAKITAFNPIHIYLNIVRAPLLGEVPPPEHWLVAGGLAMFALLFGYGLFAVYRNRLAAWL